MSWAISSGRHFRWRRPRHKLTVMLTTVVFSVWAVFWICWLVAAAGAKRSVRSAGFRWAGLLVLVVFGLLHLLKPATLAVSSPVLQVVGLILFAAGLGLAVWARIYLGRNWGMPMTERAEPELVTSGPYRFVRHPIYSGLILGVVGTALATNLLGLIIAAVLGAYFYYSASVEERNLIATFP